MTEERKEVAVLICVDAAPLAHLEHWLEQLDARLHYAASVNEAISLLGASRFDVIVLASSDASDLGRLTAACHVPIIVVDAAPSVPTAVRVMSEGAHSYVAPSGELLDAVRQVVTARRPEVVRPRWSEEERTIFSKIVNRSAAMNDVIERLRAIAKTPSTTALILGESGVGKELIATAIHQLSDRSGKPFIPIDCGAIPETLIESELFGHEKGAFSGAIGERIGRMEMAHGGTLFLDEVGELPLAMQAKLLRVLEERQVWRIGSSQSRGVDVRVVAATNRDLRKMVEEKTFRADLYYRLSVFLIHIPPLKERGADVLHLADHFIARFSREFDRQVEGLTPAAKAKLVSYSFPGNVRELKNIIEEAMVGASGQLLEADDLNIFVIEDEGTTPRVEGDTPADLLRIRWGEGALDNLEREAIGRALAATNGNQTKAAQLLGIARLSLARAMARHGIRPTTRPGRPMSVKN